MVEGKTSVLALWRKTLLLGAATGVVLVILTWVLFPSLFKAKESDPLAVCTAKCDVAGKAFDSYRRVGDTVTCYCVGDIRYYVPDIENLTVPNWSVGL